MQDNSIVWLHDVIIFHHLIVQFWNIIKLWCVMGQRLKALCSSSGVSEQSGGSNPGCDTCVPEEDVFHHN